ncbi:MAG: hypothetical protein ACON5E_02875 [Flavobacteriales bacterium]
MKNIFLLIFIVCFFSCANSELECSEWESEKYVSNDFFDWEWECVPILNSYTYNGNWNAQVNVVDQSGNSFNYQLNNLSSNPIDLKIIKLDYPYNGLAFSQENGYSPNDSFNLSLLFVDAKTLDFTINDTVFDPHVESTVIYNGEGQIIKDGADSEIRFNCDYLFNSNTYVVSFSASRYN